MLNTMNTLSNNVEDGLTQRAASTLLGISVGTVNRRVRDGDIALLPNGRIDPASLTPSLPSAPRNVVGRTASQARAERDHIAARMAALDYAQRVGQLTATAEVDAEQMTIARGFRDTLLSLPAQIAPGLINMPDPRQIEATLRRHINQFLVGQAAALHDKSPPP
ncbi:hypothetical protein [Sandarakinorhabdus sp.]|uniref:hypothetical protein n=1 Tax=Sandarakinorhabdus sp. TaxID=1916663 RepID=UPI003567D635